MNECRLNECFLNECNFWCCRLALDCSESVFFCKSAATRSSWRPIIFFGTANDDGSFCLLVAWFLVEPNSSCAFLFRGESLVTLLWNSSSNNSGTEAVVPEEMRSSEKDEPEERGRACSFALFAVFLGEGTYKEVPVIFPIKDRRDRGDFVFVEKDDVMLSLL